MAAVSLTSAIDMIGRAYPHLMLVAPLLALAAMVAASGSAAHDVKDKRQLDRLMGDREKYFQSIDKPAPDFTLRDMGGKTVRLANLRGKIVVLHFIFASCTEVCPLHAARIAEIQAMVNRTPMKSLVRFVTITTDPAKDTLPVLGKYGKDQGLDTANWMFLTTLPDQPEETTRRLAARYGHKFVVVEDGAQVHGVVTHVIDRDGHWVANFHGLRFDPANFVVYLNALINDTRPKSVEENRGLWGTLRKLFE